MRPGRGTLATLAALSILSCADSTDPSERAVTSVAARVASDSIFYGQQLRAIAVATGDSADAAQSQIEWSSSDTTVAVIDPGGLILGVGIGSSTITARLRGHEDHFTVRVVLRRYDQGVVFKDGSYSYAGQCAIAVDDGVYCRLIPSAPGEPVPDSLRPFRRMPGGEGLQFTAVHTALDSQCGLVTTGQVYCWGRNAHFIFASRVPSEARAAPVAVKTDLRFSTMMTAGHSSICAVNRADDVLYCWGHNDSHQLGRSPSVSSDSNVAPVAGNLRARMVSGSNFAACALDVAGAAHCWGNTNFLGGSNNLLGVDPSADGITPAPVVGGLTFTTISNSEGHRCGLTAAGDAYCWGINDLGQLGIGTTTNPSTNGPQRVHGGLKFTHISVSYTFGTCGITPTRDLYCWGDFSPSTIHDRIGAKALEPYPIAPGAKFIALSRYLENVCAITVEGHAVCW